MGHVSLCWPQLLGVLFVAVLSTQAREAGIESGELVGSKDTLINLARMHRIYVQNPSNITMKLEMDYSQYSGGIGREETVFCMCYETYDYENVGETVMCRGMGALCIQNMKKIVAVSKVDMTRVREGHITLRGTTTVDATFLIKNMNTYQIISEGRTSEERYFPPFVARHHRFERKWYITVGVYVTHNTLGVKKLLFKDDGTLAEKQPIQRRKPIGIERRLKEGLSSRNKDAKAPEALLPGTTTPSPSGTEIIPKVVVATALRICILVAIGSSGLVAALSLLRIVYGDCLCGTLLWHRRRKRQMQSQTTTMTTEQVILDDRRRKFPGAVNKFDEKKGKHELTDATQLTNTKNTYATTNDSSNMEDSTNQTSAAPTSEITKDKDVKGQIYTKEDKLEESGAGGVKMGDDDHVYEDASIESGSDDKKKRSNSKSKKQSNRRIVMRKYGVNKQETQNLSVAQKIDAQLDGTQEPTKTKDKRLKTGIHKASMTSDNDENEKQVTGIEDGNGQRNPKTDLKTGKEKTKRTTGDHTKVATGHGFGTGRERTKMATGKATGDTQLPSSNDDVGETQEPTKAKTLRTQKQEARTRAANGTQHESSDNVEETQNAPKTRTRTKNTGGTQLPSDQEGDNDVLNPNETRTGGANITQRTKTRRSSETQNQTHGNTGTQAESTNTEDRPGAGLKWTTNRTQTRAASATQRGQSSGGDGDEEPVDAHNQAGTRITAPTQSKGTEALNELETQKPTRTVRTRSRSPFNTQATPSKGTQDSVDTKTTKNTTQD